MNPYLQKYALKIQQLLLGFDKSGNQADTSTLSKLPPIFILAPPRSGSTIIFQHLIRKYQSSYITNLMALAPRYMLLAAKLQNSSFGKSAIKSSVYGFTSGLNAPSEAGAVNRFWFENENHESQIRNTIAFLSQLSGGNFINKNLYNCLRIEEILSTLPECTFVKIRRNSCFVAQSILLAKKQLKIPKNEFWSVPPPGHKDLTFNSQEEQVAWQATEIKKIIDSKLETHYNFKTIEYEAFCESPENTIKTLGTQLKLSKREIRPDQFQNKKHTQTIHINRNSWNKIKDAVSHYENS